jgi:V-type H+-transporting ATPase subunit C
VDKSKFKIGTLDQLMELNETLVKVDQTLESTVKKMEKVVFEIEALYRNAKENNLIIEPFVEIPVPGQSERQQVKFDIYVKNFSWESMKYTQSRSLVELAGKISDKMKVTDNDIKKTQDELNETRSQLSAIQKKEGDNYATYDVSDRIYQAANLRPEDYFVERTKKTEMFADVIAIVNKTKIEHFKGTYEKVIPWIDNNFTVVPRSAKHIKEIPEDKYGNQVWRIVVFKDKLQDYLKEGRNAGLILRPFTYDLENYKKELEQCTKLEDRVGLLTQTLYKRGLFAFSELYIALLHLKVMRAFIDGVLRFGIPPRFAIAIVHPQKGMEK